MPGEFGGGPSDDGLVASTDSNQRSGAYIRNNSSEPAIELGGNAVFALTHAPGASGVLGANNAPPGSLGRGVQGNGPEAGVGGWSDQGTGVVGQSNSGSGVVASTGSAAASAIYAHNDSSDPAGDRGGIGVFAVTASPGGSGVFGANNAPPGSLGRGVQGNGPEAGVAGWSEQGVGVLAQSAKIGIRAEAPIAGHFRGDVEVTGDIRLLGADCAEDFDVRGDAAVDCGSVMVLDDQGGVRVSDRDYDCRVAGVVSGGGAYRPAIILDRGSGGERRLPLALMGKVYCKVDATEVPIVIGDLLTTSSTPGHAMKASDRDRAFGAVIGKALQPCSDRSMIAILVALQ